MRTLGFLLRLACAYKARVLCNGVFVSGLEARLLSREDAGYKVFFHLAFARIDRERRSVECSILGTGLFREKAVHVDGIGAVLLSGTPETAVRALVPVRTPSEGPHDPRAAVPWPVAESVVPSPRGSGIDQRKVEVAVDRLFDDRGRHNPLRTRAVLVAHDGKLVCERYAPGFGPATRMLSWSMAKSVVSALVGILAGQGRIRIDEPAPVPEWADGRDPRHAITPSQLLRMSSGLAWTETYGGAAGRRRQPHAVPRTRHGPLRSRPAAGDGARHGIPLLLGQHEHPLSAHARPVRKQRRVPRVPAPLSVRTDRDPRRSVGHRCLGDDRRVLVPVRHGPGLRPVRHVLPG